MKRLRKAIPLIIAVWLLPLAVYAETVPRLVGYQGKLTNSSGAPLSGSYHFTFKLYDSNAGGNLKWSEDQVLSVDNGLYNVVLGTVTALDASLFDTAEWLDITVEGESLTPRQLLTASPYALHAVTATYVINGQTTVENLGGGSANQIPFQTAPGATGFLGVGASGKYLTASATGYPLWADQSTIVASTATVKNNQYYSIGQSTMAVYNLIGSSITGTFYGNGAGITGITATIIGTGNYVNDVKVSSAIYADGTANAKSISGVIGSTQIFTGALPADVVVSSITSRNYFNNVKVSSAIYADGAGNAVSILGVIGSTQIFTGALPADVVASSITSRNYFNDIKVSSAIFADSVANAGSISGVIQSTQIAAGKLPDNVYVSSVAVNSVTDSAITGLSGSKISNASSISISSITAGGYIQMAVRTAAELQTLIPANAGQLYFNSTVNKVFVSTGTEAGSFAEIGSYSTGP